VGKLWQKYECEKHASNIALSYDAETFRNPEPFEVNVKTEARLTNK